MSTNDPHYKNIVEENTRLNEKEYSERKIVLSSYPRSIFVQIDAPCNQDCLFCSRPDTYRFFDLEDYRRKFEDKMAPAMERAERLNLTGSGELLSLPQAQKNLGYFNRFAHAEKMFATNGSTLTPKMIDFIASSGNRYTIHVSMHSFEQNYHRIMTQSESFDLVLNNVKYLAGIKKQASNLTVNFIFLLTTKNIDALPGFAEFAAKHNADGVVAYYNYVYRLDQRELSCCLIPEKANEMLDAAEQAVRQKGLNIRLMLPPRFHQKTYGPVEHCGEAWSQIMINPEGDIISCDVAGDSHESILDKSFMEVWNGRYYTGIRERLAGGEQPCSRYCFRANPAALNDFRSHIITRGKTEQEITRFVEGE